jgi:hypothetical protein
MWEHALVLAVALVACNASAKPPTAAVPAASTDRRISAPRTPPLRQQFRGGRTLPRTPRGLSAKRVDCALPGRLLQIQPATSQNVLASQGVATWL